MFSHSVGGVGGSEHPEPQLPRVAPPSSNPQFATLIQRRPPIPHGMNGGGKLIPAANQWTFSDSFCLPGNEHKTGQLPPPIRSDATPSGNLMNPPLILIPSQLVNVSFCSTRQWRAHGQNVLGAAPRGSCTITGSDWSHGCPTSLRATMKSVTFKC